MGKQLCLYFVWVKLSALNGLCLTEQSICQVTPHSGFVQHITTTVPGAGTTLCVLPGEHVDQICETNIYHNHHMQTL